MLDDVELREAQRDYLDFLDDEVRLGRPALAGAGDPADDQARQLGCLPVTRPG